MKKYFFTAAMATLMLLSASCNKQEIVSPEIQQEETSIQTKAYGEKSPTAIVYVETNDVNPLNVLDYELEFSNHFFDVCELFAANIHKEVVNGKEVPTVYLNDKLTPILEGGLSTYVAPIQAAGIKVFLTMLGDWQHIGLANMNDTQQKQFANILAYVYKKYKLDGIGFDDEYADYPWFGAGAPNRASFAGIINYFKQLCPDAMVHVFDYGGYTGGIDASKVTHASHGMFQSFVEGSNISNMPKAKWSPMSFNLGQDNNLQTVLSQASTTKTDGYGSMMFFNLRTKTEKDPTALLQKVSDGAYGGETVICNGGDRARTAVPVPSGHTITNQVAKAGLPTYHITPFDV